MLYKQNVQSTNLYKKNVPMSKKLAYDKLIPKTMLHKKNL